MTYYNHASAKAQIKSELIGESFQYTNEDGTKSLAVIIDIYVTTSWRTDEIREVKYKISYIYHFLETSKYLDFSEIKGVIEN